MAIYCPNPACGKALKSGAKFCGYCGTVIASEPKPVPVPEHAASAPAPKPATRPADTFRAVNRMPQGIALGTDEQIVKKYTVGRYTLRQGAIDVIVTNKRVIRYEESNWLGLQSNRIDEVNIDAVHGVSCTMARSASIVGLAVAGLLSIVGLLFLFGAFNSRRMDYTMLFMGAIFLGIAVVILVNSFRPSMVFSIQGALGSSALETSVNVLGRMFGRNNSSIIFQFRPTAETTVMLKEIGACIYDLKTLGDKAIEKWR